ncbi:FAD-binding oxidoreductase [Intrasporangium chromatireducens]|uniref:FAD-binding oxidoreductase n=1 Tax=Intrasporangium chromatireducens TaxID=1386088 RepID=UPI001F0B2E95|nr:FAD-binding oxidoreductase [Intrasporangium chromatireducens]
MYQGAAARLCGEAIDPPRRYTHVHRHHHPTDHEPLGRERNRPPARRPRVRRGPHALERRRRPAPRRGGEPRTARDVAAAVRSARRAGLRIAAQSTGHNAGPLAEQDLSDVMIIRTGALNEVTIDPELGIARVGAGSIWDPVVAAAGEHGLAALHGSSPDVGVAGYSLGGGLGWYARKLGLQANNLTAVVMVTPDGDLVRADEHENGDLFWALRGGGGNFGVVTALEFRLHPIESAYAGWLVWDVTRAHDVLRGYEEWAAGAPDEVSTSFRILNVPPLPEVPEPFRGRSLAVIDGAVLGSDEYGADVLQALRALRPEMDTFGRMPAPALARLHMDPEGPTPAVGTSTVLGRLGEAGIETFVEAAGVGPQSGLIMAELRQLGGAVGRPAIGGGALSHIEGDYVFMSVGIAATPELAAASHTATHGLLAALEPWSTGRNYLNFAESRVEAGTAFDTDQLDLLRAVRAAYDPDEVMVANHRLS